MVERIRALMQEQNIKQVDFAEKLDLTPATLAKYISKKEEHRRDIPNSILSKIASLLKVDIDYLLGMQDERVATQKDFSMKIPYLESVECPPELYSLNNIKDFISVDVILYSENMYAIKATTTEMHPEIKEGDICTCVHNTDQLITDNMLVHYSFKDKYGIRMIKVDEETNQISLVPLNLNKHKIIIISEKDSKLLEISKITTIIRKF